MTVWTFPARNCVTTRSVLPEDWNVPQSTHQVSGHMTFIRDHVNVIRAFFFFRDGVGGFRSRPFRSFLSSLFDFHFKNKHLGSVSAAKASCFALIGGLE